LYEEIVNTLDTDGKHWAADWASSPHWSNETKQCNSTLTLSSKVANCFDDWWFFL